MLQAIIDWLCTSIPPSPIDAKEFNRYKNRKKLFRTLYTSSQKYLNIPLEKSLSNNIIYFIIYLIDILKFPFYMKFYSIYESFFIFYLLSLIIHDIIGSTCYIFSHMKVISSSRLSDHFPQVTRKHSGRLSSYTLHIVYIRSAQRNRI